MRIMSRLRHAAILMATTVGLAPVVVWAGAASSYLQSAHQLEKANDLRGAEIQLRNAAEAEPANGAIRIELAQIYLRLGNANAAQAELFAAHMRGAREETTAPLMAQALLESGEFGDLLKNVPAANRPPKTESLVRTYRGMAELSLHEIDHAHAMFADAERMDPRSTLPLIGEARLLLEQHQLDAAAQKVDQALKIDPRNGDALDVKGLTLAAQGKPDAAMQQFAGAIAANPRNLGAMLDRASLDAQRGNLDAAEKDLQAIRKISPGSAMGFYLQAVIDAQRGKFKEADALLDKLRGAMSGFPPAFLVAAEVKFRLGQLDQAQAFAQKFIAQAGDQPKAYELLAGIAMKRGDVEGGIRALEKVVQIAPNDAEAMGALGEAYIAHGDLEKAKEVFDRAALKAPKNAPVATARAIAHFASGDRQESVAALSDVFKGGKGSLMAGPPLVVEALQAGQIAIADQTARQLVAREPANAMYQELFAAVRIAQRDYQGAEPVLRALLDKQPSLSSARRDLAQVYLSTNRPANAKKLYQDWLRSHPADVDSLERLADIAFRENDDGEAFRLLTRAQSATPADPSPSLRIVAILGVRRKWPDAISQTRTLQQRFPNDASVPDVLARLYLASGNRSASLAVYKGAVARFPHIGQLFAHYAAVFAADKNYAAAAPLALRSVQLDPQNVNLKRGYVSLVYLSKGPDAALAAAQSITADKNGQTAALMTADVLEGNHNRAAAIAILEKTQLRNPSGILAARLAGLYQADKQSGKALALLEAWTKSHPADVDARFALAIVDSAAGRMDQALNQYEWLTVQKPHNVVILNNLAWLYDQRHDARARTVAEKAMQLAPSSSSVADTLGWIMVEQGDGVGAIKYLAQASATQPTNGTIQYHYAVVLSKTGKTAEARGVLQKLLKLDVQPDTKSQAQLLLVKLGGGR
ncbi:MAG TPA: XrtA/PEP-CTERM system TPR-repeat protein PrsT [Rhizomicrobium sp.]|nr:XrtA/PEP-CTERM system TPR-repeat protein PrsT [Rhizomicrobium sp.]